MNCEQANQIDLVDYLHTLGYDPKKIKGNDYWYHSPFREEKEASFKVNRSRNIWYDHGLGDGGTLVDFATGYYHSGVSEVLQKISFFHEQKSLQNIVARPPLHPHQNALFNEANERDGYKNNSRKAAHPGPSSLSLLESQKDTKKYCRQVLP